MRVSGLVSIESSVKNLIGRKCLFWNLIVSRLWNLYRNIFARLFKPRGNIFESRSHDVGLSEKYLWITFSDVVRYLKTAARFCILIGCVDVRRWTTRDASSAFAGLRILRRPDFLQKSTQTTKKAAFCTHHDDDIRKSTNNKKKPPFVHVYIYLQL